MSAARSSTGLIDIDSVLLGDMNDDGLADAIVFNGPGETTVDVYLNDGAGGMIFADSIAPSIGTNTDGQIVDLDGDGDLDVLFAANEEGRGIYGYINDGTGVRDTSGTPSISEDEDGTIGVSVAADFDGDGMVEVVTAGSFADDGTARGLRVFDVVTTAMGVAFVLKSTDTSIVGNAVAFGDFDGDTDLDILLTPPNSAPGDPDLSLLVNDGAGNFTNAGQVIPPFDTSQFSFAPIVTVEDFGDVLFL